MKNTGKSTLLVALFSLSTFACGGGSQSAEPIEPTTPGPIATEPTIEEPAAQAECAEFKAPEGAEKWMTWEGGVDVAGMTDPSLPMPNVLVHVAKMVHTPVGSAPGGMILYQPDPKGQPVVVGFVSTDAKVAAYFGPNIFAGTPFEAAPALTGTIEVSSSADKVTSRTEVGGHVFEVEMTAPGTPAAIDRAPADMTPFQQKGTEAGVGGVTVKVDGQPIELTVPPVGIAGGPGAVWAPCGVYTR